jgi:hypothetical protein
MYKNLDKKLINRVKWGKAGQRPSPDTKEILIF